MQKSKPNQPTKAKDDSVEEYTTKELEFIDKYHAISDNNFEDEDLYDLIIKYNYDNEKIMKDLNQMMRDIKLGDEFKWHEQGKSKYSRLINHISIEKKLKDKEKKESTDDGYQKNFKNAFKGKDSKYKTNNYYYHNEEGYENNEGEYRQGGGQNYRGKTRGGNYRGKGYNRGTARGGKQNYQGRYQEQKGNEVLIEKELADTKITISITQNKNDKPVIEKKPGDQAIEIKQEKVPEAQIETHKEMKIEKEVKKEDYEIITQQKPTVLKKLKEEEELNNYKSMEEQILKESIFNPVKAEEEVIQEETVKPIKEKEEKPKLVFEKQKTEEFSLKAEIKKTPIQPTPTPIQIQSQSQSQTQIPKKPNEYQPQPQMRYPIPVNMPGGQMMDSQGHYPPYYVIMPAMMPYEQHEDGSSGNKGQKPYPNPYIYPFVHPGYMQDKDQIHPPNYDYQYSNFPYEFQPMMPMGMDPSMYGQKMQQPEGYGFKK